MSELARLHLALADEPSDDTGWLALADCLEEGDEPQRAELVRLQLWLRRRLDDPLWPDWEDRLRALWSAGVDGCQPTHSDLFGIDFVLVPPGEFWMGARQTEQWLNADELPRHRVTLTRGFWLARTLVTLGQWRAVMGERLGGGADERPVDRASYDHAKRFCQRYGELVGRACRLPSEAEWEYACRAGTATSFCSGDGLEALKKVGWCSYNGTWDSSGTTRRVGQFRPNSWGLFDMHGNVWEWCGDAYEPYPAGPVTDPNAGDGDPQVIRGGSWRGGPWFCRSAERWPLPPEVEGANNGFRIVLELS
jgi:uncharacterized protein (TIGR02996 family)